VLAHQLRDGVAGLKLLVWNIKALKFIKELDGKTRREIGTILMRLQRGDLLREPQSKPMKMIDKDAYELRVNDRIGNHRVIYVLSTGDKILIPHAFTKKTQKTPKHELDLSRQRLKELLK
jgi:phage-related protein